MLCIVSAIVHGHCSWTLFTHGIQILASSPVGPKIVKKKKKKLVDLGRHNNIFHFFVYIIKFMTCFELLVINVFIL